MALLFCANEQYILGVQTRIDPRVTCVPISPTTLTTTNFAKYIIYNDVATLRC